MFEFNEFEPRLNSAKNRFQLSAGLNFEADGHDFKWNQSYLSRGLNSASGFCAVTMRLGGTVPPHGSINISINPVIYLIRLLYLQVYLFWCSATLFVSFCLLPCNSASAYKHSLQRFDADVPHCRRLVCVGRVSKQELSRNFSVPFLRLNM